MRLIRSDACVAEGTDWLAARVPEFDHALRLTGPLPLRLRPDGFGQLLSAIVSQQVSTASAAAIWDRVQRAGLVSPDAIRAASDADLAGVGLSRPKIRYFRALAEAGIDFNALRDVPGEEVIATLTSVTGIGRWTAEIYTMFSLGHADAFAAGDLALQESARTLFSLEARPSDRALREMAEPWRPWRSVAARILWAWYRVEKGREGLR